MHPHEAATGLLALIYGATTQEIRHLTADAIDHAVQAVHLPGRPHPTPLDPWTWAAVERCLAHRQARQLADAGRAVQTVRGHWRAAGPPR